MNILELNREEAEQLLSKNDYDQEKAINNNFRFNFSSREEKNR